MGTGDDSDRHQQVINDSHQNLSEIDASASVGPQTNSQSEVYFEDTECFGFDEEGNLVRPKTHKNIRESVSETERKLLEAYNEVGTISEAAELLDKPDTQVATLTLDALQDKYGLVTVDKGEVEYTLTGKQVVDELEPSTY